MHKGHVTKYQLRMGQEHALGQPNMTTGPMGNLPHNKGQCVTRCT